MCEKRDMSINENDKSRLYQVLHLLQMGDEY